MAIHACLFLRNRGPSGGAIAHIAGTMEVHSCVFDSNIAALPGVLAIFAMMTEEPWLQETQLTLLNSTFVAGRVWPPHPEDAMFIFRVRVNVDYVNCTPGSTPGEASLNIPADRDFTGCPFLCPRGMSGPGGPPSLLRNLTSGCVVGCEPCTAGGTCGSLGLPAPDLCAPGHHNPDTGSQTDGSCRPCESGSFQTEVGATACVPCPAGSYIAAKGSTACSPCSAGGYCADVGASSASVFQLCQPGTWSDIIGLNSSSGCQSCGIGTYQPITGASSLASCLPCPLGTASSAIGVGACKLCEPGKYQPNKQASSCLPCEEGSYCTEGAAAALPCRKGSFSRATDLTSAAECTSTDAGFFAPTGSIVQTPCNPGTIAAVGNMGACMLCEPGEYQPNSKATSCLPCEDENLGVYCPNSGTSTPTPCPGGTYSNATGMYSDVQCISVDAGGYASTGSKFPEACPASGFTCPGRAGDEVNNPPGSKPILVDSGQASVDVEMETVTFDLEVDMRPEDYDEAAVVAELAALYGVSADLISLEATPISDRRMLSVLASSAAQRLRLTVTILVPTDFVDEKADILDIESSLTAADGASSASGTGGSGVSTAGRFANRLAAVNSAEGLSAALGFNVTSTQDVLVGTVTRQMSASCAPGYWCSAANRIPCVPNTFQPLIDQIDAGACKACPDFSQSPSSSASLQDCKCRAATATAAGYYDNEPAGNKVSCNICTAGSTCPTIGTTTATLNISVGWYRTSSSSTDLRRCPDGSREGSGCTGGIGDEGPCKPYAACSP